MATLRFRLFRRTVIWVVVISLLSLAWTFSARIPVVRTSKWAPLAFSTDGQIIAVADLTSQPESSTFQPGGPIHLLRADDLTPVGAPVQTPPTIDSQGSTFHLALEIVEFSPKGDLLAVVQPNRDAQQTETLELHLIQLPGGDIWKSLPIPYDRFQRAGGIARQLFSTDGHLVAWHEYSAQDSERFDTVRVWDVAEELERFAIDGVTYPAFSPDGKMLAVVETYNKRGIACRLYDTHDGQLLHSLPLSGNRAGWHPWPEFSSDGRYVTVNTGSSTGKGPSVDVFDVASGQSVFEAREWSPHFVTGPILMTVKDDSVIFRETATWQVLSRVSFSLPLHSRHLFLISSEAESIPGTSYALVGNYYDSWFLLLSRPCRSLYLDFNLGHSLSCIDSKSGSVTKFTIDDGLPVQPVLSPTGGKLALQGVAGTTIWKLPPSRSWVPVSSIAGFLALFYGCRAFAKRRTAIHPRMVSVDTGTSEIS